MRIPFAMLTIGALLGVGACASFSDAPAHANLREVSAGESKAKPEWRFQAELDAGVAFLLTSQNADGSFGSHGPQRPYDITLGSLESLKGFHNASTALAAMALMDLDEKPETTQAAQRAFAWLVDSPESRRATMAIFYNTWAHLYCAQAFSRALQDSRFADLHGPMRKRAQREIDLLLGLQGAEGGWGYYDFSERTANPSGKLSTSFTTAAALVAIYEAREVGLKIPDLSIEIALDTVERQRVPNGAYVYSHGHILRPMGMPNRIEGSLCRSQAGNFALKLWDRMQGTDFLEEGLANLFQHHDYIEIARQRQFPHETWFKNAPYYYYFGHFYAAEMLDFLPNPAPSAATLADLIARTQDSDGSFWDYPLYGYTKAYGTGYGVSILNTCRRHLLSSTGTRSAASSRWYQTPEEKALSTKKPEAAGFQLASGEWRHEEALERAAQHLITHQNEKGQFGSPESRRTRDIYLGGINSLHAFGEGAHAIAWMGLADMPNSPRIAKALDKGLSYMLESPRTGRVNDHTFYNTWSHCYMLEALSQAYLDARFAESKESIMARARRELTSLLEVQGADGGFGYFDFDEHLAPHSGKGTTPFNTATALDSFAAAEAMGLKVSDAVKKAALDTLEDMRIPSGAFLYGRAHLYYPHGRANQIEGSLGRSQSGNFALHRAGRLEVPAIKKSLDDLFQHHDYIEIARQRQMPHETWFANAPYYYYFGHVAAAKCVAELDPADQGAYAASLADFVAATQDSDGCFWDFPLYDFGKAYGTGFALTTLIKCKSLIGSAKASATVARAE